MPLNFRSAPKPYWNSRKIAWWHAPQSSAGVAVPRGHSAVVVELAFGSCGIARRGRSSRQSSRSICVFIRPSPATHAIVSMCRDRMIHLHHSEGTVMTITRVLSLLPAAVLVVPLAFAEDSAVEAQKLADHVKHAKVSLERGLQASEKEGKPISGKFEMEDG